MEASPETISSRRDKLNAQIAGKSDGKLINRECLLDAFQALFDECSIESLQKYDKQIAQFVEKHKSTVLQLKRLRVNVSDFEIKDVIGRGHFGEVHLVKEKQTGDVYAMKTIRKCDSIDKTSFDVERNIMAFGTSPWITSLQYAFQDSIYLFYVMEYHPGGDLLGLLYRHGGTLPESAATFYLAELVLALEDLHSMGFVHRDVKPDNVLLDRCGHLKLADFGSAVRLSEDGVVDKGVPAGTPDYVAPEVLQSVEGKPSKRPRYGAACDFWSLGVLAYELTMGKTPFASHTTTATYSRIMNHGAHLKFPSNALLTQAYVALVKGLIADEKSRLNLAQIKRHSLFKNVHFDTIREQVPPFVPKITSHADTSNFTDLAPKKTSPHIDNFKKRTQFSGRNLPFVGFTYTPGGCERGFSRSAASKDETVKQLRVELEQLRHKAIQSEDWESERLHLEKKLAEKTRKLEGAEGVREKLERDLAATIAETTAAKRLLDLERKDRAELERKALELIKAAKIKWETTERHKIEPLKLEIQQQKEKIVQLVATNGMLNEQLQRAFELESKHKEIMDAARQITRRSVVGLENRLDKAVADSKLKISHLEETLDRTLAEKHHLENEILVLKTKEKELLKRLDKSDGDYQALGAAASEAENLVKHLERKVDQLEKDVQSSEDLGATVSESRRQIKKLNERNADLEHRIQKLTTAELEYKTQVRSLEKARADGEAAAQALQAQVANNQKKIDDLERRLSEEDQKSASLKQQLSDLETSAEESQQLKELRVKSWKVEKELGNAKIDKRILERELKEANAQIKEMTQQIDTYKAKAEENKKMHEKSLLELNSINENLSLELVKLKETCRSLEDKLEYEQAKLSSDKNTIDQLKMVLHDKEAEISDLRVKINLKDVEVGSVAQQSAKLDHEKNKLAEELATASNSNDSLAKQLKETERKLENAHQNLEALREACVMIEGQVIEYEKLNMSVQQEKATMAQNTEKLIGDLCRAKEEVQEARKQTNEEKSLKLLAETKTKRLEEDVECLQNELSALKVQLMEYKECASNLSEELTHAEEKITDLEVTVKSHERHTEELVGENNQLKEEVAQYLTQLAALKEAHYKTKHQVQELSTSKTLLKQRIEELQDELYAKTNYFDEREIKHESIIQQQTKLIHYLQVKVDESNKKKSFTDKIFGHSKKENQPPVAFGANSDLESQLAKQKRINRDLQEEIYKLKIKSPRLSRHRSEIASPRREIRLQPPSDDVVMEGWLKIHRNGAWEKSYGRATTSSLVICKDSGTNSGVLDKIEGTTKMVLEPLSSEIDAPVADSDLPFVVKLERLEKTPLVLMFLSPGDRDKWYDALGRVFGGDKPQMERVAVVPHNLHVHCLLELGRSVRVLGTNQGLYAPQSDLLVPIGGLDDVRVMDIVPESKLVVMIAGAAGVLVWCDLNHLLNLCQCAPCTKPHVSYKPAAASFNGFHFLQASKFAKHQLVCAATSRRLLILKYDLDADEFAPVRVMDTAEPLACALFTEHSLVVGVDKVFEIDLVTFAAEEFLDASDARLSHATTCHKMKSFPMAVVAVCDNPKEYLLCYKEFCVFVDEYGRCSRDAELKPSHLPLGFRYIQPCLYVFGARGVSVWKVEDGIVGAPTVVELNGVRFVGASKSGVYVHHQGKVQLVDGRKLLDLDDVSEVSDQDDRFSFTSSIVQSLDGNLSDGEESGGTRRVKFSQTNL